MPPTWTAFAGHRIIASGPLHAMLRATKLLLDKGESDPVLIFEDQTGRQVDFNFQGTLEQVLERAAPGAAHAGPGRPRLGVVSREVSLLPRHWEWLEQQPSGASAALRRLVEDAIRSPAARESQTVARAREAASRFMTAMAGNMPGYEEASRALFAGKRKKFKREIKKWPEDVRAYTLQLGRDSFANKGSAKD